MPYPRSRPLKPQYIRPLLGHSHQFIERHQPATLYMWRNNKHTPKLPLCPDILSPPWHIIWIFRTIHVKLTSRFRGSLGTWAHPDPQIWRPNCTVWWPSVQFKCKKMNFRALIFYFFKKIPASLCLSWILYFFHILLVSLCSLSHLMCMLLHYIESSHNLSFL